jgi:hypothetical protein
MSLMPQWAKGLGKLAIALGTAAVEAYRNRNKPPMRIDDLHVGATTTDAVDRAREEASAKWPDADTTRFPRPPRVPREGGPS